MKKRERKKVHSLLDSCYSIALKYYYAQGIYEALCEREGEGWVKELLKAH